MQSVPVLLQRAKTSMPKPVEERRRSTRLSRAFAVTVRTDDGVEHKCATRDISAAGVFFYCTAKFAEHSPVELVMTLPPELTCGEPQWVCAHATVMRLEPDLTGRGRHGIAARIERLEIMPELHG